MARVGGALVLAVLVTACGGSSDSGLTGKNHSSGGSTSFGGSAGVATGGSAPIDASSVDSSSGGSAGTDASPVTGGSAGMGGSAGASLGGAAGATPVDAGPDGNDPIACPPQMPASGSGCNVFVNSTDCIYGFKHCVCTVSSWLCVP